MNNYNEVKNHLKTVSKLAAKVLRDRQLLLILSDKIYELMLEDLRQQRERSTNYDRRLDK